MTAPVLEIEGLSSGYDGVPVIHDVNLTVHGGEVVTLLGANGAGKTTTLLTISGLLTPMAGVVKVMGSVSQRGRPHRVARRGVAHLPEDRGLFYDLTAEENLRIGPSGEAKVPADERVARAVELFPALGPLLRRAAGLLSGGEQQMLAMARAVVGGPKLLLIDEMSHGLAPVIVERMLPMVRDAADRTGCGVLLVEQHVEMALEVSDRACVMSRGTIALDTPAARLIGRREVLQAAYLGDELFDAVAEGAGA